ncbi:recombinase family protein [Aminipila terrae]|uniref:Recombinase family protein n=1 Tax=Aminipila terrae TaxID=2697030 RepID=A0A6P1MKU6_9FIRM|nr:recombinase family protein [Aminipila terrae]QHI72678.1 recombinase family protein [Aminipila terrae]
MKLYGYHRTSTTDQHLDRGVNEIQEYCTTNNLILEKIFTDQQTGKNFNRPRYTIMKEDVLRDGDILLITEIDRLGRNKEDTLKELRYYKENGIRVMILEIPTTLVDYSSLNNYMAKMIMETINNMLIEMYTVFAQVEIEKKEKRQREGIEAMKARGEWGRYGRPKAIDNDTFEKAYKRVLDGEIKPFECIRELGMTKATFYRYKRQFEMKERNRND